MSIVTVNKDRLISLFDETFLDWLNCKNKYGAESTVTVDYKSQCFGMIRALRRAHIVDQETVLKVIDCLYDPKM